VSNNDIIRCEHPGPAGSTCVKPYGHTDEEGHHYAMSLDMPPDIGRMIDSLAAELERGIASAKKARKWYYVGMAFFWSAWVYYVFLNVMEMTAAS
jgi:hypothetical protein